MNPLRGILLKLCAVTLFVVMAALIKATAHQVPAGEAVFFRSVVAIPVIFLWLAATGQVRGAIKVISPMGHALRGVAGTAAMGLNFAALGLLPLPEARALGFAHPILLVLFAALILGERLRAFRIGAVALGLFGVVVVIWPRLGGFSGAGADSGASLGVMLALAAAVASALSHVFIRSMAQVERTSAIVFWFSVTSAGFALLTVPFGWVMPGPREMLLLVGAGVTGSIGQLLMTAAYRHADAGVIAPFEYFSMLVAVALGWFFFSEAPTAPMLAGAALVIVSGLLIIWRERRLGMRRDPPKVVPPN